MEIYLSASPELRYECSRAGKKMMFFPMPILGSTLLQNGAMGGSILQWMVAL